MPEDIEIDAFIPDDFHQAGNGFKPVKYEPATPLRGISRLVYPQALPLIDFSAAVNYEGSISKTGDNADWDWGMYKDMNGEWVLLETNGPGCIYNFTQHRYPTSSEPTFRFYFDNEEVPKYEIKQSEFERNTRLLSLWLIFMKDLKMEEEGLFGLFEALFQWSLLNTARLRLI